MIQCEGLKVIMECVAIAKGVGDVLDSHNNQTYSRRLPAAVLRFFPPRFVLH